MSTEEFLDEALVLWMPGAEIPTLVRMWLSCTSMAGPAVIEAVIQAALQTKLCRIAEPGEFTRRALDAGRMDLTQAEAIGDLTGRRRDRGPSGPQAGTALPGQAARVFEGWRRLLLTAMAALEASIDFPDEIQTFQAKLT